MEKLCMISLKDLYVLGYSSYAIDDKGFIERINDKHIFDKDIFDSNNFIPMKRIEENNEIKYVDMLTGKEFYPQVYDEEETKKLFSHVSNWKKVYEISKPFSTKDGSVRFIEGSIRNYDKKMINSGYKAKILGLRLQKIYLENSLLYKTKMNEQVRIRNLESKLKSINKLSK